MQHHRVVFSAIVTLLAYAGPSRADDSIFDFVAPRADQQGSYVVQEGAIISGGVGTLAPIAGWFQEAWKYRVAMTITNASDSDLQEWPIELLVDASELIGDAIFRLAQPTGADLRVVSGGAAVQRVSLGTWDLSNHRGRMWLQIPSLATGDNAYELYFGNATAAGTDSPVEVFTYSEPYASRYALEPSDRPMVVASATDDAAFTIGSWTGTLATGELYSLDSGTWEVGQSLSATGPFEVGFDGAAATEAAPLSFASRLHSVVINRGSPDSFIMLSPYGNTTVAVSVNNVDAGQLALTQGVAGTYESTLAANSVVTFSADLPILVSYRGLDGIDGIVLPPPASEVWGFRNGTARILAVDARTHVELYYSNGAATTLTINAGAFATLPTELSGVGLAVRLIATDDVTGAPVRITVVANGDGDGGDAISFYPEQELGRTWVVPTDGRFVQVAVAAPATSCTMTTPSGSVTTASSAENITAPNPGALSFGSDSGTNIPAGSVIACDAHGYAFYEDAATDDERNLYPMESHRKLAVMQPAVELSGSTITRYLANLGTTIETPDVVAANGVSQWTDFRVADNVPSETFVSYQVSVDSGQTWLVPENATTWVTAAGSTSGASAGEVRDAIRALDSSSGRLRVRTVLLTNDGVSRPSVDAIRVFYSPTGSAANLRWDSFPAVVHSGEAVTVGITAVDQDGNHVTGLNGELTLSSSHTGQVIPSTMQIVAGRAASSIKLTGAGDDITLRATGPNGIFGNSAPFDLSAPADSELEVVSGNEQFGLIGTLLGAPLVVRVTDGGGNPIGGTQVTFAVLEGGGVLQPSGDASTPRITDGDGQAKIWLELGATIGAQRVRVQGAGQMVEFIARADDGSYLVADGGGGCACNAGGPAPRSLVGAWLLVLIAIGLTARPRRRRCRLHR